MFWIKCQLGNFKLAPTQNYLKIFKIESPQKKYQKLHFKCLPSPTKFQIAYYLTAEVQPNVQNRVKMKKAHIIISSTYSSDPANLYLELHILVFQYQHLPILNRPSFGPANCFAIISILVGGDIKIIQLLFLPPEYQTAYEDCW